jgi:hypothetical protein
MFERIRRWFVRGTVTKDTKMNVIPIQEGLTLRKIKRLQQYISDYTVIKNIKQNYLNRLQNYSTYRTISIECHNLQQQIKILDSQLADMDVKLNLLKKEL